MEKIGKTIMLLITLLLILSMVVSCGPQSTTKTGDETQPSDKMVSNNTDEENIQSDEPITLTMWDLRTEGSSAKMIDTIIDEFTKENGNITIKHSAFKVDDLRNTIKPAINSGEGPDVFSYDAGAGYLGVLAKSGLALDMTQYAEKFEWNERFHDWALEKGVYDGKLYGVANELELLGMFYNKKLFEEIGATTPETYDEFLDICEKFKKAGITPIILDDKDQWPGFHYESMWLNSFVGPDKVKEAIANEAPWNRQEFGNALDKLYELVDMGYTTAKPLGVGYDDANKEFYAGKGAMRPTGTWMVEGMVEKMGDNVGFFYLPPASSDIPSAAPGGLGEAVVVSANSKNPDAAMKFVDFMFSDEMVKIWYEHGMIPSVKDVDYSTFKVNELFKTIVDEINSATDLGENIDVLMPPKVNDVTKNYVQELLAGKKAGQECMDIKQKTFEEEIQAGSYTP